MQNNSEQACGWSQIPANAQIHVIQFFYFEHVLIVQVVGAVIIADVPVKVFWDCT